MSRNIRTLTEETLSPTTKKCGALSGGDLPGPSDDEERSLYHKPSKALHTQSRTKNSRGFRRRKIL